MKVRFCIALLSVTSLLLSCKREYSMTGFQKVSRPHYAEQHAEKGSVVTASAASQGHIPTGSVAEEKKEEVVVAGNALPKTENNRINTDVVKEEYSTVTKKSTREIRQKQVKKEVDPRLSRGLWMTIFGGIATALGIIFMAYAPTGLFVFAFGIVFLVGVITLIMYKANPKPKM